MLDVDVLIVGGGAAGLTTSMELSRLGVGSLLVERHPSTSLLPKAHIINSRTMEIFRLCGVSDAVFGAGATVAQMSRVAWHTSLTGPTALHGREIGHVDSWGGGTNVAAYARASPQPYTNLPLIRLEPLLRRRAAELAPGMVRFGQELRTFAPTGDGITAEIIDCASGESFGVRARFLVAADGGRTIGPALGIEMDGDDALLDMVNTYMTADLSEWFPDDRVVINFYINPDGAGSLGSGVLIKAGPGQWGVGSEEWVFSTALLPDDPAQFDATTMVERMRRSLGLPYFEPEIHIISPWRVQAVLAARYREGPVFLMGDAAHRHPPTGGLGLNTAVADAHNLAWKLQAVLRGSAPDALLDSYETERRPVARAVIDHSVANLLRHSQIDAALELGPDMTTEEGWARFAEFFDGGPEFDERRRAVAGAIDAERGEFAALGMDLGYAYGSGALVPEGSPLPAVADPLVFDPGTRPGQRMPHAWLTKDGVRVSTFDLADQGRFTLLVEEAARTWCLAASETAEALDVELDVIEIGEASWRDSDGAWAVQRGVGADGAVLVRPDGHVGWRACRLPSDPGGALRDALRVILGHHTTTTTRSADVQREHAHPG